MKTHTYTQKKTYSSNSAKKKNNIYFGLLYNPEKSQNLIHHYNRLGLINQFEK